MANIKLTEHNYSDEKMLQQETNDGGKNALLNLINESWNIIESKKSPLPPSALNIFSADKNLLEQIIGLIGDHDLSSTTIVNGWDDVAHPQGIYYNGTTEEYEDGEITGKNGVSYRTPDKQNGYSGYDGTQSPERNQSREEQLFSEPNFKHFSDVVTNNGDIDVDSLCFTHQNDVNHDDNITLLPRWPTAGSHDVITKPTTVVPSYENLVNLQRDGPLFMYVPQPAVHSDATVGDVGIHDLSDFSDTEASPDVDEDDTIISSERRDSDVQSHQQPGEELQQISTSVFARKPTDLTIFEGETAEISCQLNGPEPYDVYWFRDTAVLVGLDDDDRCSLRRHGNTFSVHLCNTVKSDSGHYLCVAVNSQGQSTHRFLVLVTAGGDIEGRQAPRFIRSLPQDVSVIAGQTAELNCQVAGYPEPQVLWFRDGNRIKDGSEYTIDSSSKPGRHRLIIHSNVSYGIQEFRVTARNIAGEISTTTTVDFVSTITVTSGSTNYDVMPVPPVTIVTEEIRKEVNGREDMNLYPNGEQLMAIAERAANKQSSNIIPLEPRMHSLLGRFTRSLDSLDPPEQNNHQPWRYQTPSSPLIESPMLDTDEDVDTIELELSFQQFNALFEAGIITKAEKNRGRVKRSDLSAIDSFLRSVQLEPEASVVPKDGTLTIDCGLKRVDPKRYQRDYVVNTDQPQQPPSFRSSVSQSDDIILSPKPTKLVASRTSSVSSLSSVYEPEEHNSLSSFNEEPNYEAPTRGKEPKQRSASASVLQLAKTWDEKITSFIRNDKTIDSDKAKQGEHEESTRPSVGKLQLQPLAFNNIVEENKKYDDLKRSNDLEMDLLESQTSVLELAKQWDEQITLFNKNDGPTQPKRRLSLDEELTGRIIASIDQFSFGKQDENNNEDSVRTRTLDYENNIPPSLSVRELAEKFNKEIASHANDDFFGSTENTRRHSLGNKGNRKIKTSNFHRFQQPPSDVDNNTTIQRVAINDVQDAQCITSPPANIVKELMKKYNSETSLERVQSLTGRNSVKPVVPRKKVSTNESVLNGQQTAPNGRRHSSTDSTDSDEGERQENKDGESAAISWTTPTRIVFWQQLIHDGSPSTGTNKTQPPN